MKNAERVNREARIAAEQSARAAAKVAVEPLSATKMYSNIRVVEREESDFNRASEARDESRLGESSEVNVVVVKTKPIAKATQSDYIAFFKTYYRNLAK